MTFTPLSSRLSLGSGVSHGAKAVGSWTGEDRDAHCQLLWTLQV